MRGTSCCNERGTIGYCYFSSDKTKFRDTGFAAVFAVSVSMVKCCQKMLFVDRKMCVWSLAFQWEALCCKVMPGWGSWRCVSIGKYNPQDMLQGLSRLGVLSREGTHRLVFVLEGRMLWHWHVHDHSWYWYMGKSALTAVEKIDLYPTKSINHPRYIQWFKSG